MRKLRKALLIFLATTFLVDVSLAAQQRTQAGATKLTAAAGDPNASANAPVQDPRITPRRHVLRRRSYEREALPRRHSSISRNEAIFMVAIAGTSMGIGAIAAGGKGLAIGTLVGGWGAFMGHLIWKHVK